ncbi:MAG TPA: methyltransferase domain-containing protein [Thermoplasmata archaeon]
MNRRSARPALSIAARREWTDRYASTPYRDLPWFSPHPYPWVAEAVKRGVWRAGTRVLDVGCGAGTNALFLARRGFRVAGIDVAEGAIAAAQARARSAGLDVDFRVGDALRLPFPDAHFGGAIDIGCFHTLPPRLRRAYSRELARVLHPRRSFALSWVAREFRSERGPPHRLSLQEVTDALEEEFLFLQTEYRASSTGRPVRGAPSVYCAVLGRRSFPRPALR